MPLSYKALLKGTQLIAGSLPLLEMQFFQVAFGVHVTNNNDRKENPPKKTTGKKKSLAESTF